MKTLTLQIENHSTLDNGGPVTLTVTDRPAHVGRKGGMTWVLPDPTRHISGHHFDVVPQGGGFVLTDLSSNGTFLQGERYRLGGPHDIRDGDRFTVGHYIIRASIAEAAVSPDPQPAVDPAPPQMPPVPDLPPLSPAPPEQVRPVEPAAPAPPQFDIPQQPETEPQLHQLPAFDTPAPPPPAEDFDDVWGSPVSAPPAKVEPSQTGLSRPPSNLPEGLTPSPVQSPRVTDTGRATTQSPDFSRLAGGPPPTDLHQRRAPAPPPAAPPQAAPSPVPPPMPPVAPAMPQTGMAPSTPAPTVSSDEFLQAFMEGAGITDESDLTIAPRQLGLMLGQIARFGTEEMMQMLQERAAVKLFMSGEDRTMRVAAGNNPMKFISDPNQAFETMFLKPREGYMTGDQGFRNALGDIRKHQKAVIAALQPALAEMLGGLSPDEIEKSVGGGMLGGSSRKAWDEFTKRWESRAAQGENGMLDAFIKSFSRHYAEAIRKL